MPIIKIELPTPEQWLLPIEDLLNAFPIHFHLELPELGFGGTPPIPVDIGLGPLDFGVEVKFTCPGYPICQAASACTWGDKWVWRLDPQSLIIGKIPGIPSFPVIPKLPALDFDFPPRFMIPILCPKLLNERKKEADKGEEIDAERFDENTPLV